MAKKLAQTLGTKNRKEQEQRAEYLLAQATAPLEAITITIRGDKANWGVVGQPAPDRLLEALDVVRDDILAALVKYNLEKEQQEERAEGIQVPIVELGPDEEPPEELKQG